MTVSNKKIGDFSVEEFQQRLLTLTQQLSQLKPGERPSEALEEQAKTLRDAIKLETGKDLDLLEQARQNYKDTIPWPHRLQRFLGPVLGPMCLPNVDFFIHAGMVKPYKDEVKQDQELGSHATDVLHQVWKEQHATGIQTAAQLYQQVKANSEGSAMMTLAALTKGLDIAQLQIHYRSCQGNAGASALLACGSAINQVSIDELNRRYSEGKGGSEASAILAMASLAFGDTDMKQVNDLYTKASGNSVAKALLVYASAYRKRPIEQLNTLYDQAHGNSEAKAILALAAVTTPVKDISTLNAWFDEASGNSVAKAIMVLLKANLGPRVSIEELNTVERQMPGSTEANSILTAAVTTQTTPLNNRALLALLVAGAAASSSADDDDDTQTINNINNMMN